MTFMGTLMKVINKYGEYKSVEYKINEIMRNAIDQLKQIDEHIETLKNGTDNESIKDLLLNLRTDLRVDLIEDLKKAHTGMVAVTFPAFDEELEDATLKIIEKIFKE